jgi:hypothetical protein
MAMSQLFTLFLDMLKDGTKQWSVGKTPIGIVDYNTNL